MAGTIWQILLDDLLSESREAAATETGPAATAAAWKSAHDAISAFMQSRARGWSTLRFPFGSEMPWDSTGQEEVYGWCQRYGFYNASNATLDAVLAYSPRVPSWAYQGNARRYFDFIVYGGSAPTGTEREFHHYGAPLNSLVTLEAYRGEPDDLHLLEVGLGGVMGTLTLINQTDGLASMGWHGSPSVMQPDPTDCDFGIGYFGHAINTGAFLVNRSSALPGPALDCYLCNHAVHPANGAVSVFPRDSFRRRVYISPLGLELLLEAGRFAELVFDQLGRTITVVFEQLGTATTAATTDAAQGTRVGVGGTPAISPTAFRLKLSQPALPGRRTDRPYRVVTADGARPVPTDRGCYSVPPSTARVIVAW